MPLGLSTRQLVPDTSQLLAEGQSLHMPLADSSSIFNDEEGAFSQE